MDIEKGNETEPAEAWARDERVVSSLRNDTEDQKDNIDNAGVPLNSHSKTATSELTIG